MRKRVGHRRWLATFKRFDGTRDSLGQEMKHVPGNWDVVFQDWPCEFISTVGGQMLRGRMVTEKSTHVLYGHYSAVKDILDTDSCFIDGEEYGITSMFDPEGVMLEMRVELRKVQS